MAERPERISDSGGEVPEQSDVAGTTKLNVTDLSAVLEDVHDAHGNWYGIGLRLGLEQTVLQGIKKEYSNTKEMLCEMLGEWLKQVTPVPTWVALIEALRSKTVNEPSLAKQLEKCHILPHSRHGVLTHTVSNITDRQKQLLGELQVAAKQIDSQLESYKELLQQIKKVDPSNEALEDAQERPVLSQSQSDATGLKTDPERALHTQLSQLASRISSLEPIMGVSELSQRVPGEPVIKEMDPLSIRNTELEEELGCLKEKLGEVKAKNVLLTKELEDLKKEKISIVSQKDEELALKARDLAKKSKDYELLHDEMQQLQKQIKSQISDESHALPDTAGSTETAAVDQ